MSTQPHQGGRRPIDRILAPGFADAVGDLSFADLRERRRLVEQEEVDLSYARRLLQGRLDLLRAEQGARAPGGRRDRPALRRGACVGPGERPGGRPPRRPRPGPAHHRGPQPCRRAPPSRGAGRRRRLRQRPLRARRRRAAGSHLAARRRRARRQRTRHQVQRVMDALTAELGRRYASGEAKVEDVLAAE